MPSNDTPLTIQFEQNGELIVYQITDAATLTIKGTPELNGDSMLITGGAELEVKGVMPWKGIRMTVNIAEVNIRHEPNTNQDVITRLKQGTEIIVFSDTTESIGFLWRQIISPLELRGKWIAQEKIGIDQIYIVPVGATPKSSQSATSGAARVATASEPSSPVSAQELGAGGGAASAQEVKAELVATPDYEPAPLTGRFQLVKKQGPNGAYTALAIDGDDKPKLGVNIREFPHFGIPQWKWADANSRASYCQAAKELNMKWVRFFTPHISYNSLDENMQRIRKTLDVIRDHGLVAVVTLTDSLADVGMFPREDGEWHEKGTPMGHYHKDYFNSNAFRNHYLPYVKQIVGTFKDHAGVGMWQLMNEPAIYTPPASDNDVAGFARWIDETSAMIYEMDTIHPISIGMINVSHIKPPHANQQQFAIDFYSKRKHIHVVTCHSYQNTGNGDANAAWDLEDDCMADINAAAQTGRAMIWTEFGSSQAGNRKQATERFLNRQLLQNRCSAALQWGFMITGNDTGIGDRNFGWSPANINKEYNELRSLFASYSGKVSSF